MTKRRDLSGQKFGLLTVIGFDNTRTDRVYYLCRCDCGKEKSILAQNFTGGKTRSCGCLRVANITSRKRTENPVLIVAKKIWRNRYSDGCSFDVFFRLAQLPCHYCGISASNHGRAYTRKHPVTKRSPDWAELCQWDYNGLDRIDSSKSHLEDNVVPCCYKCNWAKGDMTVEEFKAWIKRLYHSFVEEKAA